MRKCVTGVYTPLFSVFKTYVILSQKKIGQRSRWTVVFSPLVLRHLVACDDLGVSHGVFVGFVAFVRVAMSETLALLLVLVVPKYQQCLVQYLNLLCEGSAR